MIASTQVIIASLLAALTLSAAGTVAAEDVNVDSIMAEISQLTAEKEKNNEQIKIDLQTFQDAAREETAKRAEADQAKAELAALESQGRALIGQYGGSVSSRTVTCTKNGKTIAACESARLSINAKIDANSAKLKAATAASTTRAEKAKSITDKRSRNQEIDRRLTNLRHLLAAAKATQAADARKVCTAKCAALKGPPDQVNDAAVQCLQNCWEGALSHTALPNVRDVQRPVFSATPNGTAVVVPPQTGPRRTAEQAIEEYKASGAARPGPQSFRMRDVPPPKF